MTAHYAIMIGGRHIWIQDEEPLSDEIEDGDLWSKKSVVATFVRNGTTWVGATGTGSGTGAPTDPNLPGTPTDVDRNADINGAITQFMAEFKDSSNRIIVKEEATTKVRSERTALALVLAALKGDTATFDAINSWANTNLKRSLNSVSTGTALWASQFTVGTGVTDWNWNVLAENLRVIALARICQTQNRQADIDELSAIARDLEAALNTDEGRYYQVADGSQQAVTNPLGHHSISGGSTWMMRIGGMIPLAYRELKAFTGKAIWDSVLNTYYEVITKTTDTGGGLATTAGLIPDYNDYSTNTHDVGAVTSGTNGWTATFSTDFGTTAVVAPLFLYGEHMLFAETRAKTYLTGAYRTWATAQWGDSNKFTGGYNHAGTETSTTQKLLWAYGGYFALKANNSSDTTAAAIKSSWLSNLKVTNAFGTYFRDVPSTGTATSTSYNNGWMIIAEAIDAGLFVDLANTSGIAGKYNSTVTQPGTGGDTSTPTTPQPTGGVKLAIDRNSLAGVWAAGLTSAGTAEDVRKKARAMWLRDVPQGLWSGPEWDSDGSVTQSYMTNAVDAQSTTADPAWFQLVMYGIPGRDLGGASAGGSAGANQYRAWCDAVISKIGNRYGVIVLEPDSIAQMLDAVNSGSKTQADFDARMALIREAVVKIRNLCPNARVYLDAAHAAWKPDPSVLVPGMRKAGIELCHGFVSNVSNNRRDETVIPWSEQLVSLFNLPAPFGYIWDTGRSGKNPAPDGSDWQNPLQVQFGRLPQYGGTPLPANPRAHGWLWVKRPGESDGADPSGGRGAHGGPPAGQLFIEYLWNPGVGDNVSTTTSGNQQGSGNSGMLQRFPTPGVALT